jgi:hypothetical protein
MSLVRQVQEQLARTELGEAGQDAWPTGPHVLVFAETYSERDYKLTSFLFRDIESISSVS